MNVKSAKLLNAAVAGLLATGGIAFTSSNAQAEDAKCYGVNKCKGVGECGSKKDGHSCAGHNKCAGEGWLKMDKDLCLKLKNGRLTEEMSGKGQGEEKGKGKAKGKTKS